jgi:hypothetical protein
VSLLIVGFVLSAKLSPLKSLSLTVASLSNYLEFGLSGAQLSEVASTLAEGTGSWLKELLKLRKHSAPAAFTKNEDEARLLVVRAALHKAFPDLQTEGFLAIKQSPIIYTSLPSLFSQQLLAKLGLGTNNIRQGNVLNLFFLFSFFFSKLTFCY